MSQQLQITGGAKVRSLEGVITGSTGVLGSLPINGSNGIPQLDVNGKILVSQLPNSVMEYLGTWNAATNTPTLVNGTGNAGDVYLCNVAGTVNFGAGPITFGVGDQVIYSGTIWQKASGSTGTVTSVAVTESGDALTITGSPITTSGTINIGFAGTSGQYVNGAGGLTTFPTLLSSVGLSMPSAFSVANSPLTANGTIAVTGAGVASQYVRGDGTLANFPTSGGGGGAVSYYLNGSINQGTFGGNTYYEMNKVPVIGVGTDFTINANGYIAQFITDANDPALLEIPSGNWNFEMYFSASSGGGTPSFYVELYKYNGSTFTLIASSSAAPEGITNGTAIDLYTTALAVPTTSLTITDRLAVRVYVTHSGRTITLHTENSHLCQVITTFSTGITALNGLTAQVQYFGTGTSGTDFNISSTTATHTFNLPIASATNTGKLSSSDWTTFNNKISGSGTTNYLPKWTGSTALGDSLIFDNATNVGIGTASPAFKLDVSGTARFTGQLSLGSTITNGTYTYTLPGATGVFALTSDLTSFVTLGTLQTITGTKIYSSLQYFDNNVYIKHGISGSSTNYTTLGASASGLNINLGSGTSNNSLIFASTSTSNTYTFPNATGTIALTSDLSGYISGSGSSGRIPYFNGTNSVTSTANLNWDNSNNFITTSGVYVYNNTTNAYLLTSNGDNVGTVFNVSATRWGLGYSLSPSTLATAALSWNSEGRVSIGNTNNTYNLDVTGTLRNTTSAYFATSSGSVGIGTTSPTKTLQIDSGSTAAGGQVWSHSNGTIYARIGIVNPGVDNNTEFGSQSNNSLVLLTANTEKMRITNTGSVGIGTTNPQSFLHLASSSSNGTAARFVSTSANGRSYAIGSNFVTGTGEFSIYDYTAVAERMTITSTGNVGIGISAPTQRFQVYSTASTTSSIFETNNVNSYIALKSTSGTNYIGNVSYGMSFEAGGSERMRISSGGNLLIGSTADNGNPLQVSGVIGAKGTVCGLQFQNRASSNMFTFYANTEIYIFNSNTSNIASIGSTTGVYTPLSDINKKKDFEESTIGLNAILGLKPTLYRMKSENNTAKHLGFIAQEVKEFIPQAYVESGEEGNKFIGLDYQAITTALVNAIKELETRLKTLENK